MLRRTAQGALVLTALTLFALAWHCDLPWFERHAFLPQQFFIVANPRIAWAVRAAGVGFGVLLLIVARFLPHGKAARPLIWALVLSLPAMELLLQWRTRRLLRGDLVAAMDALTADTSAYGVTLKPSLDQLQLMSGREIRFITDAEGRRTSGEAPLPQLPSLVFTGESTVVGHGLQWSETFPAILGARFKLQTVNLASMNYRVDQSWLRLASGLPKLAYPKAVVSLFMPGLLGRSFDGRGHPLAMPTPSGHVMLTKPGPLSLVQQSGFYRLWRHLYWSDGEIKEAMLSMAALLHDTAALAKERGIPCIFVVTGHTPEWMAHGLFGALDYVVVEIPPEELLADGHPNPQGSLRIANALDPKLRKLLTQ